MKFFRNTVDTYLDDTEKGVKMGIYSLAVRPINMLRSTQVRAASPHTSTWGLARLSARADSSEMKVSLCYNLYSRIKMGTVSVGSLYSFDRQILGEVLKKTNETALIRLVMTVRPSKFQLSYKGKGTEVVDVIDQSGKITKVKQPYEQDAVRTVSGYNLPFFVWMRQEISQGRWDGIVRAISNNNRLLGQNLGNLDGKLANDRETLRKQYPLPERKSIRLSS